MSRSLALAANAAGVAVREGIQHVVPGFGQNATVITGPGVGVVRHGVDLFVEGPLGDYSVKQAMAYVGWIDELPSGIRDSLRQVRVLRSEYPMREHLADVYGIADLLPAATGGDGVIDAWRGGWLGTRSFTHEAFHAKTLTGGPPDPEAWRLAMHADEPIWKARLETFKNPSMSFEQADQQRINAFNPGVAVSRYARQAQGEFSVSEDWADSGAAWTMSKKAGFFIKSHPTPFERLHIGGAAHSLQFQELFPNRAKLIASVAGDGGISRPTGPFSSFRSAS